MSIISMDPRLRGVHDDGGNEGLIRAKLAQGELVKIGFTANETFAKAEGTSSAILGFSGNFLNPDGSSRGALLTCKPGSGNGAYLTRSFRGGQCGVAWSRSATTGLFTVCIDAEVVAVVRNRILEFNGMVNTTVVDDEASIIVATDLDPSQAHTIDIIVAPDASINADQVVRLYGLLVDRTHGNENRLRAGDVNYTGQVPTTVGPIPRANYTGIRKIFYANPTTSPIDVTVFNNGTFQMYMKTVPAKDTADFITEGPTTFNGSHVASAAGLNYAVLGSW